MSCRSWWCGAGAAVELAQAPQDTPLTLSCGCTVHRTGTTDETQVAFDSAVCAEHAPAPPDQLPADTPVHIDLFAAMLAGK